MKTKLEFRYQGEGQWWAWLKREGWPYLSFVITRTLFTLEDGVVTEEEFETSMIVATYYDFNSLHGVPDVMYSGNYADAVMLAHELLDRFEREMTSMDEEE